MIESQMNGSGPFPVQYCRCQRPSSEPPPWRIKTPGSPSSTMTNASPRSAVRSARRAARWSAWVGAPAASPAFPTTSWQDHHVGSNCTWTFVAGKLCIEVTPQSKIVWISESLCIGCGICIKVLFPFDQPRLAGPRVSRFKLYSLSFSMAEMSIRSVVDC